MSKLLFITIAALYSTFNSFGQIPEDFDGNEFYFDGELIAKSNFHSAFVTRQFVSEDDSSGVHVYSKDRMEVAFNNFGKIEYMRYTPLMANFEDQAENLKGEETYYFSYIYDEEGRLTERCEERNNGKTCELTQYHTDGKIASITTESMESDPETYMFKWDEDGILMDVSSYGVPHDGDKKFYAHDTEGKLSRISHPDGWHTLYYVVDENDTSTTQINRCYREGCHELTLKKKFRSTGQDFEELYLLRKNWDTIYFKSISFDEQHQLSEFTVFDDREGLEFNRRNENTIMDGVPFEDIPQPKEFRCWAESKYMKGLPVMRKIYFEDENGNRESSARIVEIIEYSTAPLIAQPWKYD